LLGKKIGEIVDIVVPMGTIRYEVLEITYVG
jgi:transcription elongation GreA/GreB family factor